MKQISFLPKPGAKSRSHTFRDCQIQNLDQSQKSAVMSGQLDV